MNDFFSGFDAERRNFTFVNAEDRSAPVIQVGLVAVFHLVDAYLPLRRPGLAETFALCHQHYGDKLEGGCREEPGMRIRPYSEAEFHDRHNAIIHASGISHDYRITRC